ncbi:MAG TPA: Crp/Fnr family transcriptional regulator [Ruminiclostridium sp.]|jgi:CRP/FNR family transcriptional regulator|nr:Crp/Fnr family transcriptional regulator [Ruminiclostridium sp.]
MNCSCKNKGPFNCIELVPIFSSLTGEEMLEIAAITSDRTFEKGEMVYMAGEKGKILFVIHKGRVKISRLGANGKEQVIRVLGPGEFMGELSLFSPMPMSDNAEVIEKATMCMIEGGRLKELMGKYPAIAFKVMEELSKRLEIAENLIEDINLYSVEQRVAQALLKMADGKGEVLLKMTKGDFASHIGMSQETLSRKLSSFQEQGMIKQIGQRRIIILNADGLKQMQ